MVKTQFGLSMKEVQIDAGGEFKSKEFTIFLQKLGINILNQRTSHAPTKQLCREIYMHCDGQGSGYAP